MDYTTLYETWKKEKESKDLQRLDKSFYSELGEYLRKLREEDQILDEKTLMAHLVRREKKYVEKIIADLVHTRWAKVFKKLLQGDGVSPSLLTTDEEVVYSRATSAIEGVENIGRNVQRGQIPHIEKMRMEKPLMLVRFLQDLPAIIGSNLKSYGPFKAEDIASIPRENAESLIKRGVAVKVELE